MTEHYIVSPLQQDVSHKFIIAVLMEYIRSLNQVQITVQVGCRKVFSCGYIRVLCCFMNNGGMTLFHLVTC